MQGLVLKNLSSKVKILLSLLTIILFCIMIDKKREYWGADGIG